MRNTLTAFLLLLVGLVSPCFGFNEEEAAEKWGNAYVWLQTGRNLVSSGQKPLAMGSFIEAEKQFKQLAQDFPDYETKMVTYRLEALSSDIEKLKSESSAEDLTIADEYVAFIKLIEQADDERYSAQRSKALDTLHLAKNGLDSIVSRRPDEFGPAVKDQQERLKSSIAWLEKLGGRRTPRTVTPIAMPKESKGYLIKGTTEFITDSDLPDQPGSVATVSLFPGI